MYPVSAAYKSKIKELDRVFEARIQIQHSLGVLHLTDADIVGGSLIYNESSQAGEDFTIGGTVASDLTVTILNKPEYAGYDFTGAAITASIGLELLQGMMLTYEDLKHYTYSELADYLYGELGSDQYEYVPLGIFNIDEVGKQRNTIKLKAIDNMINLDKPYSLSNLSYPATLYQIYVNICNVADVQVGTTSFPNMGYTVQERPSGDLTLRDVLGYVAELSGTFAKMSRTGALELMWYKPSGITLSPSNRFDFIPRDDLVQIKGIMATVDDTTYLAGTDEYAVDLSENPLLQGGYETVLPNIFNNVKDTVFTPFTSGWQGNPAIQAGDMITQIDRDGKIYNTLVTSSTYKYRGRSSLSAKGLPVAAKGYKGTTNRKIASIIRKVEKDVGDKLTTLEQAQLNATQLIANMLGGYAIDGLDTFYVADNPDLNLAQKVWKWGIGGFGYSSTGKDGPYTTAITADGSIVAMLVAAGIVTADMVQTGLLQSEDGSTWINLDDGAFNFKNALKWDGIAVQVLDNLNRERVRIGNYAEGKYGLLIKDSTGSKTLLDEAGLLQTWQEGRADNVASGKPLTLNIFLPSNTRSINQAILRFRRQNFRAYSTGAASGGGSTQTSDADGDHRHEMFRYDGNVTQAVYDSTQARALVAGTPSSGNGGAFYIKSPAGTFQIYTAGTSGTHRHGVTIPSHKHGIEYGIYEGALASSIKVKINGIDRTSALGGGTGFNADRSDLNITPYLTIGSWNTIELDSSTLGRIDATVFIQALMGVS